MADRIIMRYLTLDCDYAEIYMKTPKALMHKHIGYTDFRVTRPDDLPMVDDIVELMTDVIMTEDREIMIMRL